MAGGLLPAKSVWAALEYKVGTFSKATTTGTQPIATVGFQPKAVIFYWTRQTAIGAAVHVRAGYGFASGPSAQRAVAIAADDNLLVSNDVGQWQSITSCIVMLNDGAPVLGAEAELVSFDSAGFTLNWLSNEASADLIHYIALGGTDLMYAQVGSFDKSSGVTGLGNQSVTGLGFRPDFVMLLSANDGTVSAPAVDFTAALGFAAAPWARATVAASSEDIYPPDSDACQRPDRVFVELAKAGTEQSRFDFVSFNRDGFTIRRELNVNPSFSVFYLALKGGAFQVGNFTKSTLAAPPDQAQAITGVGFRPSGLILVSKNRPPSAGIEAEGRVSFGASDGTTGALSWFHNKDAPGLRSDANQRTSTSLVSLHANQSSAAYAESSLASFDADGFTLNWTINNTANDEILYVAFGADPDPQVNYRSIGTAVYAAGSITATNGSTTVSGTGTLWKSSNRGRGDRIDIGGTDYAVLSVDGEDRLTLTTPFSGSYSGGYTISRQYATLQAWEDCISGVPAACTWFPVASSSLVADNRAEVGIVYEDGAAYASGVNFAGSVTDTKHTITLEVASGNGHNGVAAGGVILDNTGGPGDAIIINEGFVTIDGLEIKGVSGTYGAVTVGAGIGAANETVVSHCLIHDMNGSGIRSTDTDSNLLVLNNILYNLAGGIRIDIPPAHARVFNNTVYNCSAFSADPSGITAASANAPYPTVTLRNNIAHGNANGDFGVTGLNDASSNNFSGNASGVLHSPDGGGQDSVPLGNLSFLSTVSGNENLHIGSGSVAIDAGADLSHVFPLDIDGQLRSSGWDIGADELFADVYYRSIGDRLDYGTAGPEGGGTQVSAVQDSPVVRGVGGTTWRGANRGRGDLILVDGVPYTVMSVDSETELTLTVPFAQPDGTYDYSISRKFGTLQGWVDCINNTAVVAPECHDVSSNDLTSDGRSEVGIAYADSDFTAPLDIALVTTGPQNIITLTADGDNRHYGVAGGGVVLDNGSNAVHALQIRSDYVTVEWMEVKGGGAGVNGIQLDNLSTANQVVVRNCLVHNVTSGDGVAFIDSDAVADVFNNIIYENEIGVELPFSMGASAKIRILNNTVYSNNSIGTLASGIYTAGSANFQTLLRNNYVGENQNEDISVASVDTASSHNMSSNASGVSHSPAGGGRDGVSGAQMNFVSTGAGTENLHITSGSAAVDAGANLTGIFVYDVDYGPRIAQWDIGADELSGTTAVALTSFEARGMDGAVELTWETGSEIDNLGFNLHRTTSADGPFEKITLLAVPGLGSSPQGAKYRYVDAGLTNGVTYFYLLEDIETTGKTEMHGPVSAVPREGAGETRDERPADGAESRITVGVPTSNSLRVIERTPNGVVLELITQGFYFTTHEDGTVSLEIPGFDFTEEPGRPYLPVRRSWVEIAPGRRVELVSVKEYEQDSFEHLRPETGESGVEVGPQGTVRVTRRRNRRVERVGDDYPTTAQVLSVAYQGDVKKALLQMAPLRWNAESGLLVFTRRMQVRLAFVGRDLTDRVDGRRSRSYRRRESHITREPISRLITIDPGLYGVAYQEIFGSHSRKRYAADLIKLSRQGEAVPFHLEPDNGSFQPGVTLYFLSAGARANPYGREAVYELEVGVSGLLMPPADASPGGGTIGRYWESLEMEENLLYQAVLMEAPDRWLWSMLFAPAERDFPFDITALADTGESSRLAVDLQGGSDFEAVPDHHVRLHVNGAFVGEASWDGKRPRRIEAEILPGVLREGENQLTIENVGDTEARYSTVFLDGFRLDYPRRPVAVADRLSGTWSESGTAEVGGLRGGMIVLEESESGPIWLTGVAANRFRVEPNRNYAAVGPEGIRRVAEIRKPLQNDLKSSRNRADYLVLGPRDFIRAVGPLLEHRRRQGLRVRGVELERVYSEFGFGEETPTAIRDFIAYAYHNWQVAPHYVLLLGDGTFDFKDRFGTGVLNQVPPLMVDTTYMETVSDPAYAAVNGDDLLPDLAIGRLPAASVKELQVMIGKILAWERAGDAFSGRTVLVTDNPDRAGDFVADAEELAATVLNGRELEKIYLSELGREETREGIGEAFDSGSALMSYIGHGGIQLWADENLLNIDDVRSFAPQSEQPLLLTMNCLNGYFHFPFFDALAEALLKAEDKGIVAAFSPSGLSLNNAARVFHRALLEEILEGGHERLGDAVLEAQAAYAASGGMPEMIAIYHLFGDPAMKLR